MTINTAARTVWINENGLITCLAHGGNYLQSAVKNGSGIEISTPLDHWIRFTLDEATERRLACEECRLATARTKQPAMGGGT